MINETRLKKLEAIANPPPCRGIPIVSWEPDDSIKKPYFKDEEEAKLFEKFIVRKRQLSRFNPLMCEIDNQIILENIDEFKKLGETRTAEQ